MFTFDLLVQEKKKRNQFEGVKLINHQVSNNST